jgi:hypothetical protein
VLDTRTSIGFPQLGKYMPVNHEIMRETTRRSRLDHAPPGNPRTPKTPDAADSSFSKTS